MRSNPIQKYLSSLPAERKQALEAVRKIVVENLPLGYQERLGGVGILYEVPLSIYSSTYNKKPLLYLALGNQKNYMSLYLCHVNGNEDLRIHLAAGFQKAGKKLDMGKSCIRFKELSDLALEVIGEVVAATSVEQYVAFAKNSYEKKKR